MALILMGKEAGLGLRELCELLSTADPVDHADRLRNHVSALERRITQAEMAKELIEHALACPVSFGRCVHAQERIAARVLPL